MDKFELIPVTAADVARQDVLKNLTKMYCCEWSQYTGLDVDETGCYGFERYLPLYWERPDRKAFLLACTGANGAPRWAGFALIDRDFILHKDSDYALAEYFVLPKYRRHDAGKWMATTLFDRFPGRWEVGRNPKNLPTVPFWNRVIGAYTEGNYTLVTAAPEHRYPDGTLGDVFAFSTGNRA